jgi:hypothetical protein
MNQATNRSRVLIAGALSLANLALVGSLALAGFAAPAHAQGQNKEAVERPSGGVACPSGWRTVSDNTKLCEPMGSLAPKIYTKKEKETCASGYFEVSRVWCSTKKP